MRTALLQSQRGLIQLPEEEVAAADETLKPLIGTELANIDDKGRLLVSKKKRDRLGEKFVMLLGDSGCIFAYPNHRWKAMCDETDRHDPNNEGTKEYTRMVMGSAEDDLEFDGQGRVVVPKKLREAAKLKEKVLLVGCNSRLEIWGEEEFLRYEEDRDGYGRARRERLQNAYKEMMAS